MFIIKKENKATADSIVNQLQYESISRCKIALQAIANKIEETELKDNTEYYISSAGKIRADKPEAFYFTWGTWDKSNNVFWVNTAWGSKKYGLNGFEFKKEDLIVIEK